MKDVPTRRDGCSCLRSKVPWYNTYNTSRWLVCPRRNGHERRGPTRQGVHQEPTRGCLAWTIVIRHRCDLLEKGGQLLLSYPFPREMTDRLAVFHLPEPVRRSFSCNVTEVMTTLANCTRMRQECFFPPPRPGVLLTLHFSAQLCEIARAVSVIACWKSLNGQHMRFVACTTPSSPHLRSAGQLGGEIARPAMRILVRSSSHCRIFKSSIVTPSPSSGCRSATYQK